MDPVTSMNLPLSSGDEHVVDDADSLLQRHWILLHILHVLEPHLVVKQWLEQRHGGSSSSVHVLLHVSNWIIGVQTSASLFIQTSQDVGDVVGEEPLVVQHGGRHLSHGWGRHGLVVEMTVALHSHLRNLHKEKVMFAKDIRLESPCRRLRYHTSIQLNQELFCLTDGTVWAVHGRGWHI